MVAKNNMNILSLDPMYSSLHSKIATLYSGKKYALLSSWAMRVYLKGYKCYSLSRYIERAICSPEDYMVVDSTPSHYKALIAIKEGRDINHSERTYMAKYCSFLREFLVDKKIGLVILHNDLRWHHALAISVCKSLNIKYLVTEQGLFRPTTTIMDNCGVNAYSSLVSTNFLQSPKGATLSSTSKIKYDHNSIISMAYFFVFLVLYKIGSFLNTNIPYQHNSYSLKKYILRFKNRVAKGAYNQIAPDNQILPDKYIFVPLQLEDDTQMLIHSEYKSNQYIISEIEKQFLTQKVSIVFKKHPNDTNNYILGSKSFFAEGAIIKLAEKAVLSITVNSSAAIDIIKTNCPLFLLGDSIYNFEGIGTKISMSEICHEYIKLCSGKKYADRDKRDAYISFLKDVYSVHGAGFSYDINEIKRSLERNELL